MQLRGQVCLSSVSPGPISSEAEHVFPVGTHKHAYPTHTPIYIGGHTDNTDTVCTHTDTNSTNSFILFSLYLSRMKVQ